MQIIYARWLKEQKMSFKLELTFLWPDIPHHEKCKLHDNWSKYLLQRAYFSIMKYSSLSL